MSDIAGADNDGAHASSVITMLGMHRSGTSALARALRSLGASWGTDADFHGEHRLLRQVNNDLLEAFGGSWDTPPQFPPEWTARPESRALDRAAKEAVDQLLLHVPAVWKDPRACLTMPFWSPLLPDSPIVLIFREPREVAGSLATRNKFGLGHSYALWERHNSDALGYAVGRRTVVVSYRELVESPESTLRDLTEALTRWGIAGLRDPGEVDTELRSDSRKHDARDLPPYTSVTDPQRALLHLLEASRGVHDSFALPEPRPELSPIGLELIEVCSQLRAAEARANRAERGLRTWAASVPRRLESLVGRGRKASR